MKKSRFSEEQIVGVLKEAEAGVPVIEVNLGRRPRHQPLLCELLSLLIVTYIKSKYYKSENFPLARFPVGWQRKRH